jgi:hypothetical protein
MGASRTQVVFLGNVAISPQCHCHVTGWQTRQVQELIPVTGVEVRVLSSALGGQGHTAIRGPCPFARAPGFSASAGLAGRIRRGDAQGWSPNKGDTWRVATIKGMWRFAGRRDACPTIVAPRVPGDPLHGPMSAKNSGAGVPPAPESATGYPPNSQSPGRLRPTTRP